MINKLKNMFAIKNKKEKISFPMFSLKPKSDLKQYKQNVEMLNAAFDAELTNIALTGPYGSGKSSVIKTFMDNQHTYRKGEQKKRFFSLSLASFAEGGKDIDENEIEKCLLQQLFYKVKASSLRYSRFNKITHTGLGKIISFVVLSIFVLFSILAMLNPMILEEAMERINILSIYCTPWLTYILLFISIGISVLLFSMVIRIIISRFRISKFGYKNAEFTTGENKESIFNKYLDEIIYFFEATNYDVIAIEDLDRLVESKSEHLNIFVKLRELNYLINNSEKVNKKVYFIYAVSDKLFKNQERTKFFDIIIPVIPIVNESNANDFLKRRLDEMSLVGTNDISEKLINELAPHFPEPRILLSAINEYIFYKNKMNFSAMKGDELFALMLYKNMFSDDFEKLNSNNGFLFDAFNLKKNAIRDTIKENNKLIESIKESINNAEKEHLDSIEELTGAFIHMLKKSGYSHINIDGASYDLNTQINIDLNNLSSAKSIVLHNNRNSRRKTYNIDEFNKEFSIKSTYYDRCKFFEEGKVDRIKRLNNEIGTIESKNKKIIDYSLQEYLEENKAVKLGKINDESNKSILFMLKEGYIKEDYINYITNFYGESLTNGDMDYILNVHYNKEPDFDYKLSKVEETVNRLEDKYFGRPASLNFNIVDFLLENNKYCNKMNILMAYLTLYTDIALNFIVEYIVREINIDIFINELAEQSTSLWTRILYHLKEDREKADKILIHMLNVLDIQHIITLNEHIDTSIKSETITQYLSKNSRSMELLVSLAEEKAKSIIKELEIIFSNIHEDDIKLDLFKYITNNGHYEVNKHMIELILKFSTGQEDIQVGYTDILESANETLIKKVDENIETFLQEIYFKEFVQYVESKEAVIKLLNLEDITAETGGNFIRVAKFTLDGIGTVNNRFWHTLLANNKIQFSWDNVYTYFTEFEITEILIEFIRVLLKNNIIEPILCEQYKLFISAAASSEFVSEDLFRKLFISNFHYEDFNILNVSDEKVLFMVDIGAIMLSSTVYDFFNDKYPELLFNLLVVKLNDFINLLNEEEIIPDSVILNQLLSSDINKHNKIEIVTYINEMDDFEVVDNAVAQEIVNAIGGYEIQLNDELFDSIYEALNDNSYRIKILLNQSDNLDNNNISSCIEELDGVFGAILEANAKKSVELNDDNRKFIELIDARDIISSHKIYEEKGIIRVYAFS
ncbi:MAG: hypothetical protein KAH14_05860 [Clostridiales bacterium]|nr:hypothetical protein [Clostridiales bacterium]